MKKPSGWAEEGKFWTKSSRYGLRYMCPECGKKALGTTFMEDAHHHYKKCSRLRKPPHINGGEAEIFD